MKSNSTKTHLISHIYFLLNRHNHKLKRQIFRLIINVYDVVHGKYGAPEFHDFVINDDDRKPESQRIGLRMEK